MCGRFSVYAPVSLSRHARELLDSLEIDLVSEVHQREDQFNIAPTQRALVLVTKEGECSMQMLRWGLVPGWAKDSKIGTSAINARAETLVTKPLFRAAFKKRRCLIPASGVFRMEGRKRGKTAVFHSRCRSRNAYVRGAVGDMAWAGRSASPDLYDSDWPSRCGFRRHPRPQPVILPADFWEAWLIGQPDEAEAMLGQLPEARLAYYPVSKAMGSPKNSGPEVVEPIGPEGVLL
jgi:putative SOS response-associated peptidase YedK